jgi:hypothetical protein
MRHRSLAVAIGLAVATNSSRAQAPKVSTRDSSGVTITTSTVPAKAVAWRLSSAPTIDIRTSDTDTTLIWRAAGIAHRASDGSIYFSVAPSLSVLVFDPKGKQLVRRFGRKGRGPGEFGAIDNISVISADSVVVLDRAESSISYLDRNGKFDHRFPIERGYFPLRVYRSGSLDDGSVVIISVEHGLAPVLDHRTKLVVARFGRTGKLLDTVATGLLFQTAASSEHNSPTTAAINVGRDRLYYSRGTAYEVNVYAPSGKLERVLRLALEPRSPTESMKNAYVDQITADAKARNQPAPEKGTIRFYDPLPAVERILADPSGNIFLQEGRLNRAMDPSTWHIVAKDGRYLASLAMPSHFEPTEIGADYVLGIYHDPDSGDGVRMYGLLRQ